MENIVLPGKQSGLPWTGERYVPSMSGDIELEHLHRYLFAAAACRGLDVLDVASGEGYGSAVLAQQARSVVGVELDEGAVRWAQSRYGSERLRFVQGDCRELPLPDKSVDVAVSFETLEHFREHEEFVREVRRVLRPGGIFMISTPDRDVYNQTFAQPNAFHVRELNKTEFTKLLLGQFQHVVMGVQRIVVGSSILRARTDPDEAGASRRWLWFRNRADMPKVECGDNIPQGVYLFAMASARPIAWPEDSVYEGKFTVTSIDEFTQAGHKLSSMLSRVTSERDGLASERNSLASERDVLQKDAREAAAERVRLQHELAQDRALLGKIRQDLDIAAWRNRAMADAEGARLLAPCRPPRGTAISPAAAACLAWLCMRGKCPPGAIRELIRNRDIFDADFYRCSNPDVARSGANPLAHYLVWGWREGRDPHPLFSTNYYLDRNPGVARNGINPLLHFLSHGWREGRDPHPMFSVRYYLGNNPGAAGSGMNPLLHFMVHGWRQGSDPHPLFDTAYYLERNPQVKDAGINPLVHFERVGVWELRDPHPLFDLRHYLSANPGAADGTINPVHDYIGEGWMKNRNPHLLFDGRFYLERHVDVAAAGVNPLVHYLAEGWRNGYHPHPLFDPAYYLTVCTGVSGNPLVHYVRKGAAAGVNPHPLFNVRYYLDRNPGLRDGAANPLMHYLAHGADAGFNPNRSFQTSFYAGEYPDVKASGLNPLVHYILHGAGRRTMPVYSADRYPAARDWYDSGNPKVSIIVLNWNNAMFTLACLQSIWEHTAGIRYEVVLVDNGSVAAEFRNVVTNLHCVRVVRVPRNVYFSEGNNLGAEAARGEYLVFLNNDTTVTPGWLQSLVGTFERHPDCGAAGSKLVYPDGRLQEAGAMLDSEGIALQRGKHGDPDAPAYREECVVHYCSASALAMRRDIFMDLGGFDYQWEPAYYEDTDLCLRLSLLGLKTWYCPGSTVCHHESVTTTAASTARELDLSNIVEINRTKFIQRWGDYLRSQSRNPPEHLRLPPRREPPECVSAKGSILVYTPFSIMQGGGERYILTVAETMSTDHSVTLVTPAKTSRVRLRTVARDLGLDLDRIDLVSVDELGRHCGKFDRLVCMGNEILPPFPPVARRNIFLCQFPFPLADVDFAVRWPHWEGFETVVVYSQFARSHVMKQMEKLPLPAIPVKIIHPPCNAAPLLAGGELISGKQPMALNVGRFFPEGHCKRQDSLIKAFTELWKGGEREFSLHLVGSTHPERSSREFYGTCLKLAEGMPVHFHPNASAGMLGELYRRSSMYWHGTGLYVDEDCHPERFEHFGMTIVEAMAYGCIPIVFNKAGPAEIVRDGECGYHFASEAELVAVARNVLGKMTETEVVNMREAAMRRAGDFSVDNFRRAWRAILA